MSLECMLHFHKEHAKELGEMFNTEYFCFAVIMIKICFNVRLMFWLFSKEEMEKQVQVNEIKGCGRKEMKKFCKGLFREEEFFYNVVDMGMLMVWKKYKERFEGGKGVLNMLKVDPIVREMVEGVGKAFKEERDYGKVKERLIKEYNRE